MTVSSEPEKDIEFTDDDAHLLDTLCSEDETYLQILAKATGVKAGLRGDTVFLKGPSEAVTVSSNVVQQVIEALSKGQHLTERDLLRNIQTLLQQPEVKLASIVNERIAVSARKSIVAKSLSQHLYVDAIRKHDLVFGVGPAGTGKTYLAMAMAVQALNQKQIKRIVLTRPAVEAGEKLGFLPGDLAEKVNPYLRPLYDALFDMVGADKASELIAEGTIEVAPLAFMRGRTLNHSFIILDEAQNCTQEQMKMFLTRIGFDSCAVVTGDVTQIDLPTQSRSGLVDALHLLKEIEGISVRRFSDEDVVRHPLVAEIIRAYNRRDESLR